MRTALVTVIVLLTSPAVSHDTWPDGSPVEDWVKASCCGMAEAHRFEQSQVHHLSDGGWKIDGYPWVVRIEPRPSPVRDDGYWLFYSTGDVPYSGWVGPVVCFFAPTLY
jgi:hypothetical protein